VPVGANSAATAFATHARGKSMTKVHQLYDALKQANTAYDAAKTDKEYADAAAKQAAAIEAFAVAKCDGPWDLVDKMRALHDLVRDESSDDGQWLDGRTRLLACAIERDAIEIARAYDRLESERDEAQAAA
jgi:hypothetical protein